MQTESYKKIDERVIIKRCHICGEIMEATREIEKCCNCKKSFLPINYFGKIHAKNSEDFKNLFESCEKLHEDDLIKGISVLW